MATLKELINYSKANPNSDVAMKLQKAITGGAYDQQASQEGIDLSWAGRPKVEIKEQAPGYFERVSGAIKQQEEELQKGGEAIAKSALETYQAPTIKEKALGLAKTAGTLAGEIGTQTVGGINIIGEATGLNELIRAGGGALEKAGEAMTPQVLGDIAAQYGQSESGKKLKEALAGGYESLNKLVQENPDIVRQMHGLFNLAMLAAGKKAEPIAAEAKGAVTELGTKAFEAGKSQLETIKAGSEIKQQVMSAAEAENRLSAIQEKISPKLNKAETKMALKEGRIVPGEKPTLLKDGTPDVVLPSNKVAQAGETIQRYIPEADKMDQQTLYGALNKKSTQIAKNLEPEMTKVKIKPKTFEKINNDWTKLKEEQIRNADVTEEANVRKMQSQFEERLRKSGNKNMNDLWRTRKEYDASIPDNVKNANSLSSESLQNKKSNWLKNRAILNDAINDSASGLGDTSRQAFSDMTDMYLAKENILAKAEVKTTPEPSKLKEFGGTMPGKATKMGVQAVGLGAGLHLLP